VSHDAVVDSLGMWAATRSLPEQLVDALERTRDTEGLPPAEGIRSVVLLGMGGSGIAADVAAAVVGPDCPVPLVVSKQYECPGFVGPDDLVVAVSFSGNTEETIAAVHGAVGAGARLVVVSAGGHLERTAREWGAGVVGVDPGIPMPRAAIGAMSVAVLSVLEQMGLAAGVSGQVDAAVGQLRRRRDRLDADPSPVRSLARRIGRTLPIVYGGGALGEVAANRWKAQFNENPKVPSFANRIPELTHNEVCGWAQHGDVTRQVFTLVLLRHDLEHLQVARRFELVEELCDEVVGDVVGVRAEGDGPLAQLLDLVFVGDLLSLQLAADASVDPGPVPVLDDIKARLAT
jgi:glucose/mannose-6-phosphate isomerase